ncbi:hypothetical protein JHK87_022560 [Glycine soja]|nr:hypothetical protein JHK87_022560 [Glycine soja]
MKGLKDQKTKEMDNCHNLRNGRFEVKRFHIGQVILKSSFTLTREHQFHALIHGPSSVLCLLVLACSRSCGLTDSRV